MRDRVAAGLMAGIIAYLLIFQGVATAYAGGVMAGGDTAAGFVLCTPASDAPVLPGNGERPGGSVHDCCIAQCRTGCVLSPALPAALAGLDLTFPVSAAPRWPTSALPMPAHAQGLAAEARAPPSFSI
ncbi:hypothetical protein [Nitratireductor pacificus]|uniref:hypothetical protein n=1 Tax=Nitratireductor pacificus TaxID=1231180 RepID=UPI001AEBB972|nr:hypothetical protein [Nitratireductor pacificus]